MTGRFRSIAAIAASFVLGAGLAAGITARAADDQPVDCTITADGTLTCRGLQLAPATTTAPPTTAAPTTTQAPTTTAAPTTTQPAAAMHHACPGVADITPLGAVPPALPMMCDMLTGPGTDTHTAGANTWLDDFNHGQSMAEIPGAYKVYNGGGSCTQNLTSTTGCKYGTFLHANHWMQDIWGPDGTAGGAFMRPDRTFTFDNGKLTIEYDLAAGGLNYLDEWPEVVISASSSPIGFNDGPTPGRHIDDGGYAYGQFGGYWTLGIRMNGDRSPIAAMYDNTARGFPCGRIFEIAWYLDGSNGNTAQCPHLVFTKIGGEPGSAVRDLGASNLAWRTCHGNDPDTNCRDRFRWEITTTSLTVYANGQKWMQHTLPAGQTLPAAFTGAPLYVYFAGFQTHTHHTATARFHWDRIAINGDLPLTQSPTCTAAAPCR